MKTVFYLFVSIVFTVLLSNKDVIASEKAKIDFSTCYDVLHILEDMKSGKSMEEISSRLDSLLNTDAYSEMFKHYNRSWRPNHLPKEVFKSLILSLEFPDKYAQGDNRRADQMFPFWKAAYDDLSIYRDKLKLMESYNLQKMIPEAINNAASWLPPEMQVENFDFYVLPHGGSGGFIINNATGYDLFKLNENLEEFQSLIAHEAHHFGLVIPTPELVTKEDSLAFTFITYFVGEGTAIRFINNAPGGLVPSISDEKVTGFSYPGLMELWEEYTKEEKEILNQFSLTLEKILSGDLNEEELNNELRKYWFSGIMGRQYFLGSEFFGAIYHGFGKEGCFEAMRDPRKMPDLYNKALEKNPEQLSNCPSLPGHVVEMVLNIGGNTKKKVKSKG